MARTSDTSGEGHSLSDGRRKFFAVTEVAGYLGLGRRTAYEFCYPGDLRAHVRRRHKGVEGGDLALRAGGREHGEGEGS